MDDYTGKEKQIQKAYSHLTRSQKEELIEVISKSPLNYGFSINQWTGPLLLKYSQRTYNEIVSIRTLQRFLKKHITRESKNHLCETEIDKSFSDLLHRLSKDPTKDVWFLGNIFIWSERHKTVMKDNSLRHLCFQKRLRYYANVAINALDECETEYELINSGFEQRLGYFIKEFIEAHRSDKKLILFVHSTAVNKRIIKRISTGNDVNTVFEFIFIQSRKPKLNKFEYLRQEIRQYLRKFDTETWSRVPPKVFKEIHDIITRKNVVL